MSEKFGNINTNDSKLFDSSFERPAKTPYPRRFYEEAENKGVGKIEFSKIKDEFKELRSYIK